MGQAFQPALLGGVANTPPVTLSRRSRGQGGWVERRSAAKNLKIAGLRSPESAAAAQRACHPEPAEPRGWWVGGSGGARRRIPRPVGPARAVDRSTTPDEPIHRFINHGSSGFMGLQDSQWSEEMSKNATPAAERRHLCSPMRQRWEDRYAIQRSSRGAATSPRDTSCVSMARRTGAGTVTSTDSRTRSNQ